jgi:hypothetical protein
MYMSSQLWTLLRDMHKLLVDHLAVPLPAEPLAPFGTTMSSRSRHAAFIFVKGIAFSLRMVWTALDFRDGKLRSRPNRDRPRQTDFGPNRGQKFVQPGLSQLL